MENSFGKLVRARRDKLNISAEKLADMVGVDKSYISKIENKDAFPSIEIYLRIAKELNITLEDFPAQKYITTPKQAIDDFIRIFREKTQRLKEEKEKTQEETHRLIASAEAKDPPHVVIQRNLMKDIYTLSHSPKILKRRDVVNLLKKHNPEEAKNKALKQMTYITIKKLALLNENTRKTNRKEIYKLLRSILNPSLLQTK